MDEEPEEQNYYSKKYLDRERSEEEELTVDKKERVRRLIEETPYL